MLCHEEHPSHARQLLPWVLPLFLIVWGSPSLAPAQEWGEFSREELFATHFEEVPDADAVVLVDSGILRVDRRFRLKMRHHRRTKIFTEAGVARGEVRISLRPGDEIKDLRAHTVIPPGKKIKVGKKHMTEEKTADGHKVRILRFPDVTPGVILEYAYELRREDIRTLDPWHFQQQDYVRESRLELRLPQGMSYDAFFGWTPERPPVPTVKPMNDPENPQFQLQQSTWLLTDIPPLRPAPLQRNLSDYRTTLYVQLEDYDSSDKKDAKVVQMMDFESTSDRNWTIATSWNELARPAREQYQTFLDAEDGVSRWAEESGAGGPEATAETLYSLVRDSIRTDPGAALTSARRVIESGTASPVEKNLLLVKLLRAHGIAANPVLISTRDHGAFHPRYHAAGQLNHTIVRIDSGAGPLFVDARDSFCPFGWLPPRDHVEEGVLLENDAATVVPIEFPTVKSTRTAETEATLGRGGDLACRSTLTFTGYEAMCARGSIAAAEAEPFVLAMFDSALVGVQLESVRAIDSAPESPLAIEVEFRVPGFAQAQGYDLSCSYPFAFELGVNPLPDEMRTCPIDFPYVWTAEEKVRVTLPRGFTLAEAPPVARQSIGEVSFSSTVEADGTHLDAKRKFRVRENSLEGRKYPDLREFYDSLVSANESRLLLKRRPMGASSG